MIDLKESIYKINHEVDFKKAQGMLLLFNSIYGTDFGFLNRRVVRLDEYGHCHDLYSEL